MRRSLPSFALLVLAGATAAPAQEITWTWTGVEILGNHKVSRAEIEKLIKVPVGEPYHRGDPPFWTDACAEIKKKFDFASVDCGDKPLRVFDGRKAFLVVDIVEKGNEKVLKFRSAPTGSVAFADEEMYSLSEVLSSRTGAAGMRGHYYVESSDKGYLTYTDPSGLNDDLSPNVDRLAEIVPKHRDNLFDILRHDKDPKNRQVAANLLNWVGGDAEATLREALPMLDDPDAGVRNNLSRYMTNFVAKVKTKSLRHQLIDAFVEEIQRPSHGDRNKGLFDLLAIAKAWPADKAYIKRRGGAAIKYLEDNSILFNVQGAADELLELLG